MIPLLPARRGPCFLLALSSLAGLLVGCAAPGPGGGGGLEPDAWREHVDDPRFVAGTVLRFRARSRQEPDEPYWPYHLAEVYQSIDSTGAALAWADTSLARDPDYAPALALFSELAYRTGRHAEAIEALEAARDRQGPRFPVELRAGLALHYEAAGEDGKARAELPRLEGAPGAGGRNARSVASYLRFRLDGREEAARAARAAVAADPHNAVNHNNRGITQLLAGDPEGARASFETAIELDPLLPGPYYNLAILERFYLLDDAAGAKWFERYWALSREDPDALEPLFHPGTLAEGDDR